MAYSNGNDVSLNSLRRCMLLIFSLFISCVYGMAVMYVMLFFIAAFVYSLFVTGNNVDVLTFFGEFMVVFVISFFTIFLPAFTYWVRDSNPTFSLFNRKTWCK